MNEDRFYFVTFARHGESVGNLENRFQGQADYPLTDRGRDQARALAARFKSEKTRFDLCLTSPLGRALETAQIVTSELGVSLEVDPLWKEMDNGRIAGLRLDEIDEVEPPAFTTPYTRLGESGESRLEVYLRAGRAIQKILDRKPGRYLVVSHGAILNMAMYSVLSIAPQAHHNGPRFSFTNTTCADFLYDPSQHNWRLLQFDGPEK